MVDQWCSYTFPGSVVAREYAGLRLPPTILNPLIDAVEQAIAPPPATAIQNLGLPAIVPVEILCV